MTTLAPKDIIEKEWITDKPGVNYACPHCGHEYGNVWSFDFFGRICFMLLVLGGPFALGFTLLSFFCPEHPSRIRERQEEQRKLVELESQYQP